MNVLSNQSPKTNAVVGPETIFRAIRRYAIFGTAWVCSSDLVVYLHGGETTQNALWSVLKGVLFVAVSAVVLYWIIRNSVRETVLERDAYRERLRDLSLNGNDIIFLEDGDGRIVEANDRAVAAYGYSSQELCTMKVSDLVAERSVFEDRWKSLIQSGALRSEAVHRRADGTLFPVEFSARRFEVGGSTFIHSVIRDITARQEAERQLLKVKDMYAALFQTSQCIVQCTDRDQLFQRTCEIAVNRSHLRLAWTGIVDELTGAVIPVAKAGPASEYVSGLEVSIKEDSPLSKGIAGRALLCGHSVAVNDLWNSDGFQPWMEKLRAYGIQSWAAYPIRQGGQSIGVLALYSDDPHFFTHELSALIEEMVNDISVALDRMALRVKQVELQAELDRLKKAVEQSQVTVVITDRAGRIQYVNPAFTTTSGYSAEEVLGKNPRILKSGETSERGYAAMWQDLLRGDCWAGEFRNRRKDGKSYWEEASISPVKDQQGEITHFIAVKQDVTARREAEARARFLAFHDSLTELPNRLIAKEKTEEVMREADSSGGRAAILFIDVDNLKRVNDSLGHRMGDHLLQALVRRLKTSMRECDLLSRVSGDEFLLVVPNVDGSDVVESIAQRIRK